MPPDETTRRRGRHKTDPPPLSAREIRFAQLWVETGNATRSFLDAGLTARTRHAAEVAAFKLLRKGEVRRYIRHLQAVAARAARITVEELAVLMDNFARADLRRLYDAKGRILPPDQWPDEVACAVEGLDTEEIFEPVPGQRGRKELVGHRRKVKLTAKAAAAAKLMEWKRMLGQDKADAGKAAPPPLVVGGDADPDSL